jgi:hypothetical protein
MVTARAIAAEDFLPLDKVRFSQNETTLDQPPDFGEIKIGLNGSFFVRRLNAFFSRELPGVATIIARDEVAIEEPVRAQHTRNLGHRLSRGAPRHTVEHSVAEDVGEIARGPREVPHVPLNDPPFQTDETFSFRPTPRGADRFHGQIDAIDLDT